MVIPLEVSEDVIPRTFREDQFRSIVSTIVGNAASDSDGFAGLMRVPLDAVADAENLLPTLDTHAGEIADAAQPLGVAHEADASAALAETITQGQPEVDAFDTHLGAAVPTQDTGSGVTTGSGGGGGSDPVVSDPSGVGCAPHCGLRE